MEQWSDSGTPKHATAGGGNALKLNGERFNIQRGVSPFRLIMRNVEISLYCAIIWSKSVARGTRYSDRRGGYAFKK